MRLADKRLTQLAQYTFEDAKLIHIDMNSMVAIQATASQIEHQSHIRNRPVVGFTKILLYNNRTLILVRPTHGHVNK